MTMIERIGEAA